MSPALQIRHLDVTGFAVGPEGASILAGVLRGLSLVTLRAGRADVRDEGACALARALESHQTLATLDLRGNSLNAAAACKLAPLLSAPGACLLLGWGRGGAFPISIGSSRNAMRFQKIRSLATLWPTLARQAILILSHHKLKLHAQAGETDDGAGLLETLVERDAHELDATRRGGKHVKSLARVRGENGSLGACTSSGLCACGRVSAGARAQSS